MNFDFLEDMDNDDKEIEIQYHPQNQEDALKLKKFIEYQMQTIDVVDENNQIKKIRLAMIYYVHYHQQKITIYGKNETYLCYQFWDSISNLFENLYFVEVRKDIFINHYHIKDIQSEYIVLDNGQILSI
ncbi:MAG: hypothetical protein HFF36_03215 [Coprobacillus sp.]|nr:hypothetical protein [Coprobacillus sp.]